MKKSSTSVIAFYILLLSYINDAGDYDTGALRGIVAAAKVAGVSWEVTVESLAYLEACVNRPSEVDDDDHAFTTIHDVIVATFRDLSVFKNRNAMEYFHRVAERLSATFGPGKDQVIWAKEVKSRLDGSGVIILHVSDLEGARKFLQENDMVETNQSNSTLENGILLMEK